MIRINIFMTKYNFCGVLVIIKEYIYCVKRKHGTCFMSGRIMITKIVKSNLRRECRKSNFRLFRFNIVDIHYIIYSLQPYNHNVIDSFIVSFVYTKGGGLIFFKSITIPHPQPLTLLFFKLIF